VIAGVSGEYACSSPVGSAARRADLRARGLQLTSIATGAARRQSGYFVVDPLAGFRLFIAGVATMLRISRAKRDLMSRAAEGGGQENAALLPFFSVF